MNTSINTNTNFTGAFRIKPTEIKAKEEIPELFKQGRQIFSDILEKGDKVVVVRDQYDKRVSDYLKENTNIQGIEYYPTINTRSGLDSEKPEGLIKLINDKATRLITNFDEMFTTIAKQEKAKKVIDIDAEINKITNALRLNIENPQIIQSNNEATIIRDEVNKRTVEIIFLNKSAIYVYVKPDSLNISSTKCIVDGNGTLVKNFETPKEILKFSKTFRELKKGKVNTLIKN